MKEAKRKKLTKGNKKDNAHGSRDLNDPRHTLETNNVNSTSQLEEVAEPVQTGQTVYEHIHGKMLKAQAAKEHKISDPNKINKNANATIASQERVMQIGDPQIVENSKQPIAGPSEEGNQSSAQALDASEDDFGNSGSEDDEGESDNDDDGNQPSNAAGLNKVDSPIMMQSHPPSICMKQLAHLHNDPDFRQMVLEMFQDSSSTVKDKSMDQTANRVDNKKRSDAPRGMAVNSSPILTNTKSPSETTIYKQAFRKVLGQNEVIDKISNFVESIQLEPESAKRQKQSMPPARPGTSGGNERTPVAACKHEVAVTG